MTIDPKKGNELLAKLFKTRQLPIVQEPEPVTEPVFIDPEDPMHQALQEAQAKMTVEQRLAFLKRMAGESE